MDIISDMVEEIKLDYRPTNISNRPIRTSQDAFEIFSQHFEKETLCLKESFLAIYLSRGSFVKGIHLHSTGGITGTVVDIRLVLAIALTSASTSIIICHNHPSGNLHPSLQDQSLTRKLVEACRLLDISLNDHIILSPDGKYYSMRDAGDMN